MSDTISYGAKLVGGSTTVSTGKVGSPDSATSASVFIPAYDTNQPRPTVQHVTVTTKEVRIKCRCGGVLVCKGGTTQGYNTVWDNQCPKCQAIYQMKQRAGEIVYE